MAWTCKGCGTEITSDDELTCPTCSGAKSAWTIKPDATRQFTIGGKKLSVLRGGGADLSQPGGDPADAATTERAIVLTKAEAQVLADQGRGPFPADVLIARLRPGKAKRRAVTLGVQFVAAEEGEEEYDPHEEDPEAVEIDTRFLLVFGEGEAPAFEGVHVVDVGEETEEGFAPSVSLAALRKRPQELPTARPRQLAPRFVEESDEAPVAYCFVYLSPPGETWETRHRLYVDGEGVTRVLSENAWPEDASALPEAELREGEPFRLHWSYAPVEDAELAEAPTSDVAVAEEVPLRRAWLRGLLHLQLLRPSPGADEDDQAGEDEPLRLEPLAGVAYRLSAEPADATYEGTTDAEGVLRHEGAPLTQYLLTVGDQQTWADAAGNADTPTPVVLFDEEPEVAGEGFATLAAAFSPEEEAFELEPAEEEPALAEILDEDLPPDPEPLEPVTAAELASFGTQLSGGN